MQALLLGLCLLGLMCPALLGVTCAKAQGGDQSQQVPPPSVSANNRTMQSIPSYENASGWIDGLSVFHGDDFGCGWAVYDGYSNTTGGQKMHSVGMIAHFYIGMDVSKQQPSQYTFYFDLHDDGGYDPLQCVVYINCSSGVIPMSLVNCSSISVTNSDVTYVGNVPTFTCNLTFHDVTLPTYGHGTSTATLTFSTHFIANWTTMTVKTSVYADLTKMKLYLPSGTELPPNTNFSLNLKYIVALLNGSTANAYIPPTDITRTSVHFGVSGTGGTQISIADMTLGESYTEVQGLAEIANRVAETYFAVGNDVVCRGYQRFTNLTYGVTTAVRSDPTINVNHNSVPLGWVPPSAVPSSNGALLAVIVGGVAAVAVVGVAFVVKRRRSKRS